MPKDTKPHDAALKEDLKKVTELLELTQHQQELLRDAALKGDLETVTQYYGADGNIQLHEADLKRDLKKVTELLELTQDQEALLHKFILKGNLERLHFAIFNDLDTGAIRSLIASSAEQGTLNNTDGAGDTALHYAVRYGNSEAVETLLKYGASTNIKNNNGNIPLHEAAINGYSKIVRALLDKNPDTVDTQNNTGNTAMHFALRYGTSETVETLLEYGPDFTTIKNADGKTAFEDVRDLAHKLTRQTQITDAQVTQVGKDKGQKI